MYGERERFDTRSFIHWDALTQHSAGMGDTNVGGNVLFTLINNAYMSKRNRRLIE